MSYNNIGTTFQIEGCDLRLQQRCSLRSKSSGIPSRVYYYFSKTSEAVSSQAPPKRPQLFTNLHDAIRQNWIMLKGVRRLSQKRLLQTSQSTRLHFPEDCNLGLGG